MPVLPRILRHTQAETHQMRYIFQGETLRTARLSVEACTFLVDHIGKSPMIMDEEPLPPDAHPLEVFTVLDALRDEPEEIQAECIEKLGQYIKYNALADERFRQVGVKDHPGVGNAVGQSKSVDRFNVALTKRYVLENTDWASQLDGGEGVVTDEDVRYEIPSPFDNFVAIHTRFLTAKQMLGRHIKTNCVGEQIHMWNTKLMPLLRHPEGLDNYMEAIESIRPKEEPAQDPAVDETVQAPTPEPVATKPAEPAAAAPDPDPKPDADGAGEETSKDKDSDG